MPGYALSVETARAVSKPLWRALRTAGEPTTIGDLHKASRAHPNAIQLRLKRWSRAGIVTVLPPEKARYVISDRSAHRAEAPTIGSLSADAWTALRRIGRPATFEELLAATGASDRPLYCRLRRWTRSGHVRKIEAMPRRFALASGAIDQPEPPTVNAAGDVKRRGPSQRERLWKVMRILKRFDLPQLEITSEATRRAAEDFINLLSRAGYIRNLGKGGGTGWATYALIRDTGPKCPTITNKAGAERRLVDRNNGQSVPIGPGLRRRAREVNYVR